LTLDNLRIASFYTVATTMSSLRDLAVLEDSSTYPTWADLRLALDNWAVGAKFTYRTPTKKKDRARYICSVSGCTWCCNATRKPDGMLELRVTKRQHTCLGATIAKHSSCSSKGWLDEAVTQHLLVWLFGVGPYNSLIYITGPYYSFTHIIIQLGKLGL
jgi:MuDR family transposase